MMVVVVMMMMIIIIMFVPVATKTMGAINKDGMDFLSDLGRRITQCTYDHCESAFLFQ